jgi:hypothetical protein
MRTQKPSSLPVDLSAPVLDQPFGGSRTTLFGFKSGGHSETTFNAVPKGPAGRGLDPVANHPQIEFKRIERMANCMCSPAAWLEPKIFLGETNHLSATLG